MYWRAYEKTQRICCNQMSLYSVKGIMRHFNYRVMKKLYFVLMLLVFTFCSCVSMSRKDRKEARVEQTRSDVKNFVAVALSGSPTVHYSQANTFSVKVMASRRVIDRVKTIVERGVLIIYIDEKEKRFFRFDNHDDIDVFVSSPDLVGVSLSGNGDFLSESHVDTDKMEVSLKGSGDVSFNDIICDSISADLVGSGDMKFKKVEALMASWSIIGSGDMSVWQTKVKATTASLIGSGDLKISFNDCGVVRSLLRGSGDVTLKGNIKSLDKRIVGSGDLNTDGLRIESTKKF